MLVCWFRAVLNAVESQSVCTCLHNVEAQP